jgi:hypothetical protein
MAYMVTAQVMRLLVVYLQVMCLLLCLGKLLTPQRMTHTLRRMRSICSKI